MFTASYVIAGRHPRGPVVSGAEQVGIETQRLSASHVKLGTPLPGDVYDEAGHLLLSAGFVINDGHLLDALLTRGMYVDIRTFEAFYRGMSDSGAAEKTFDPFQVRDSIKRRLNRVLRRLHEITDADEQIRSLAAAVHELAAADAEGAIASVILDNDESYAIRHSVLTAVLTDLTATVLGWPDEQRLGETCAALSMNATVLDQQNRMFDQATPLTPQQQEVVHAHPAATCDLLQKAGVDDQEWLKAVLEHHERDGGAGYPAHLQCPGDKGRLLHLVDTFGALIASRADRKALTPAQAVRTLFAAEGTGPHGALVGALIKVLGVLPPGTFVKLANHETAVVCRHGAAAGAPVVAAVASSSGSRYMKAEQRDTQHKEWAITGVVSRAEVAVGYDLGTIWVKRIR